jgi:hypothetical protein
MTQSKYPIASEDSPVEFLRTDEVADLLRYTGKYKVRAIWGMLARIGVPVYRGGGRLLIRRDDIDEVLLTGDCVKGRTRYARELSEYHGKKKAG